MVFWRSILYTALGVPEGLQVTDQHLSYHFDGSLGDFTNTVRQTTLRVSFSGPPRQRCGKRWKELAAGASTASEASW
jgi:hypothetical protein